MPATTKATEGAAPKSLRDYPELVSVADVAHVAGVTRATIYKLVSDGELKAVHIRNVIRINRDSACDYLGL